MKDFLCVKRHTRWLIAVGPRRWSDRWSAAPPWPWTRLHPSPHRCILGKGGKAISTDPPRVPPARRSPQSYLCKDPGRYGPSDQSARCLCVLGPAPFLLRRLLSAEHLKGHTSTSISQRIILFLSHQRQKTAPTRQ